MTPFEEILEKIHELHLAKQQDYGRPGDPFHNVRQGANFAGLDDWVAAMIRAQDKMGRLSVVAQGGTLTNEGIEDSFIDLIAYTAIALCLYKEQSMREHPSNQQARKI